MNQASGCHRGFAIVPAAGRSRRMGQDKLQLPWGDATVIESLLAVWQASEVDEIVVVMRQEQTELRTLCGKLTNGQDGVGSLFPSERTGSGEISRGRRLPSPSRLSIVTPTIAPPEMKDSVLAALEYIRKTFSPEDSDAWLLAPADMPQLDPAVVNQILVAHVPTSPAIIVPTRDGKRGHPVLFPWTIASAVANLADNEGVNALLDRFPVRELECGSSEIHGDLDTPEDYQRLRRNAE